MDNIFGFYDYPDQSEPSYDPPHNGPCIVCGESLTEPVKTISMIWADEILPRSYFYRTHKICYESAPQTADAAAWDAIEALRGKQDETTCGICGHTLMGNDAHFGIWHLPANGGSRPHKFVVDILPVAEGTIEL